MPDDAPKQPVRLDLELDAEITPAVEVTAGVEVEGEGKGKPEVTGAVKVSVKF